MILWVDLSEWLFSCGPEVNSIYNDNNSNNNKFQLGREDGYGIRVCRYFFSFSLTVRRFTTCDRSLLRRRANGRNGGHDEWLQWLWMGIKPV